MLSRIKPLLNRNIVKVFIGSGTSSIVKIITTIILSKVVAEKLGPEGLGLIGQLTSFVSIALLFASGGYQNGVITYTAINHSRGDIGSFVKPSFKLTLIISAVLGVILLLFAAPFSMLVFKSPAYQYPFYCLAFTILLYSFNSYFNSFLNGISDFRAFNTLNIINSVFSLCVSVVLINWLGIKGALLAVVLSQTLTSLATFRFMLRFKSAFVGFHKAAISKKLIRALLPYVKMTIFSMILLPVSQILIRSLVRHWEGDFQMGIWEALNRVSGMYQLVISNIMLVYYLPRLSVINGEREIKKEFSKGMLFFGALILGIGTIIFVLRYIIIRLFLSASFMPVADLFLLQIAGDFFRVLYYLFAYFAIAKSLTRYYVISEIFFFVTYIATAYLMVPAFGIKGAVYAYGIMNLVAFFLSLIFIRKLYFKERKGLYSLVFGSKRSSQR